jgi:UDP-3-O-[3-hydroxymyristoyl] N-acetylglucosamine deacetylase
MKLALPLEIFSSNHPQTTVAGRVLLAGVSVASGQPCHGFVLPAPADHGLIFEIDGRLIPARHEFLLRDGPSRTTTLQKDGVRVATVEHLLAAFHGLGIDNALITLSPDGIPFKDFSAESFAKALAAVGVVETSVRRRYIKVTHEFRLDDPDGESDRSVLFRPAPEATSVITAVTDFPNLVGRQTASFNPGQDDFTEELAWARSFVPHPLDEGEGRWARVRQRYPMLPPSPDHSPLIVFSGGKFITPLRRPDELARHKLLDFLGDIMLAGLRVNAKIIAEKPGHKLNGHAAGVLARAIADAGF